MNVVNYTKLNEVNPWQRAAYHEAGHVVMCLLLGVGIGNVSIYEKPSGVEGEVNHAWGLNLVHSAKITLSGPTAEKILCGLRVSTVNLMSAIPQFSTDYQNLCQDCPKPGYQRRYAVQTEEAILDHWGLVDMIARRLLEKHVMVGSELERVYEEYNGQK